MSSQGEEGGPDPGEPVQTLESIRSDFDRIALITDESWNHNSHYHDYLAGFVPAGAQRIFEIGCGRGEFSRTLAERAERVVAIDLSPTMILMAKQNSTQHPNIDFVAGDVMAYEMQREEFDCVVSLATFHHLPYPAILRKIEQSLRPGGVFICLDLYKRSGAIDLIFDSIAFPTSTILRLLKTGRLRPRRGVHDAYAEHAETDNYLTLQEARQIYVEIMPDAVVSRHLYWRYSVIWRKEVGKKVL